MLAGVDGVVAFRHVARDAQQAQAHHFEALALEARQDVADQAALDAIGLDEDEGAFHPGARSLEIEGDVAGAQARAARS